MLRYYKKALRELEEKSNEKHHHKQDLNHGGSGVEDSLDDLSKESKERESSHKHKRDKELRRKKKKKRKESMEHDYVADEVRKKTKKKKKRRLESDVELATTSDDRESCKTQKSSIDPPIVSSNKESKKKRKRECLSEFSEGTVKKNKHSVQTTTQSEKHRHREKCDALERSRHSYEISPSGSSSLQSNTHHSKKVSGGRKKKRKNKRTEDLTTNKDDLANGNYNKTDSVNLTMDKAKLREATVISNQIHETPSLSKERLETLAKQGIKVKKGKWSEEEKKLLKFNMARYLERNNLSDPTKVLFHSRKVMEDTVERLYWLRFANDTDLYKELGKGIQRELQSITKCARRIFDKANYVGRYSEKEIKKLKRLRASCGNDWVTIGRMMDRSRMSVNRKFTKLPPKDLAEGKWANDELKRLKEAVHTVTKTTDSDDQTIFHGIYWPAVAELVKTRNIEKCRRKWLDKLCWSTTADNTQVEHWTISHDLKLITRLYNSGIMEECDVDWMELKSEYETNYAPQWLRLKWTKLKKGVPNYQQLSFEDVVDYLYREYVQTPPDETETGTSNNES